jgi:ornithine carbamoyltransferase
MSKDHCVAIKGQLVPAYRFLDHSDRIKKVTYSGEVLYNVLLAEHGVMEVNNMLCETLHPANLIAKIYKGLTNKHEHFNGKTQLSLQEKEIVKSKSLVGRLQQ